MPLNFEDCDKSIKQQPSIEEVAAIATTGDRKQQSSFVGRMNNTQYLLLLREQVDQIQDPVVKERTDLLLNRVRFKFAQTLANRIGRPNG